VFSKRDLSRRVTGHIQRKLGFEPSQFFSSKKDNQKRIWFTGENQRVPLENYDLTFSYDADPFGDTNIYFPLFYLSLDWFGKEQLQFGTEGRRAGMVVTPQVASSTRITDVADRPRFVCAFVGNPEPTRMRALAALESIDVVDVYGSAVNRPIPSKIEIAQQYRFMLCFENDLYPGYVTEKPLEAWVSGCIPLWRGLDSFGVLNPESHLNAADFASLEIFVSEVERLNHDVARLRKMGGEPLFSRLPTLDAAGDALRKLL
jgi:hypothetical protein